MILQMRKQEIFQNRKLPGKFFFCLTFIIVTTNLFSQNENPVFEYNSFVENKGQVIDIDGNLRPEILFTGDAGNTKIYVKRGSVSYVLSSIEGLAEIPHDAIDVEAARIEAQKNAVLKLHRVDMEFIGSDPNSKVVATNKTEDYSNYYLAHCPEGITDVKAYNKILVENIYSNIDVIYYGTEDKGFKYDLVIKPGGEPNNIIVKYNGAESMNINAEGRLEIVTNLGNLSEWMPRVYQNINGKIIDVSAKYILNETTVKFKLGNYNSSFPLVIDPWITYYGGSGDETSGSITTDNSGNVIFSGKTTSANFPISVGAFQTSLSSGSDAVVVKLTSAGTRVFATYYGGSGFDVAAGVDADGANNIVVTGQTYSTNLPTVSPIGSYSQASGGVTYIFVAKLDPTGKFIWATYYGGTGSDYGYDVVTDGGNNIIVTGSVGSANFPLLLPYQATHAGASADAFIVKFNSSGTRTWSTFYGGAAFDLAYGIAVDNSNNIFICGTTSSANFPIVSAHQVSMGGGIGDAFVSKINPANGSPIWSTYYGGNGNNDYAIAIAVDGNGDVVMTGQTNSTNNIASPGAFQTSFAGGFTDVMVIKFSNSGKRIWGTYLGGNTAGSSANLEYSTGVAIGPNNMVVVAGDVYAIDFPVTTCAYQTQFKGTEDQFISTFYPNGDLICSGYLGIGNSKSPNNETSNWGGGCVAVNGGMAYLVAFTACNYPVTKNAYQKKCGGGNDMGVAQLCITTCGASTLAINFNAGNVTPCVGSPVSYYVSNTSCDTTTISNQYLWTFTGAVTLTSTQKNPTNIIYNKPGKYNVKLVVTTPCGKDSLTKKAYITVSTGPTVSISKIDAGCGLSNGSANAVIGGTGSYTYQWMPSGSTTNMASNLSAGTYSLVVSTATGCSVTSIATIKNIGAAKISASSSNAICNGGYGSAAITPIGGKTPYTYNWSAGNTSSSASNLLAGTYTVSVSDASGCKADTTITITEPTAVAINILSTDLPCGGGSTITTTVSGGAGSYSYKWSNGTSASSLYSASSATYSLVVTDGAGCTSVSGITTMNKGPGLSISLNTTNAICNGDANGSANIFVSSGSAPYAYVWSSGGYTANNITQLSAGSYTVTINDAAGCKKDISFIITEPSPIVVSNTSPSAVCSGQSVTLNASANGGNGGYTFLWMPNNISGNAIIVSPSSSISYSVIATDVNGCTGTQTSLVTINQLPLVLFSAQDTTGCAPLCVEFINNTSDSLVNAQWEFGDGDNSISIDSASHCYTSAGSYSVKLTVTDVNGCSGSLIKNNLVNVFPVPVAAFDMNPQTVSIANPTVNFIDKSSGASQWAWTFGDVNSSGSLKQNPSYTYSDSGYYNVRLIVNNEFGCVDTVYKTLHVESEFVIYAPNTFTPNGDGSNDVFIPISSGLDAATYELFIYDRWGDQIFHTSNINEGWDGKANNGKNVAQEDVYIWKINAFDLQRIKHNYVGHVSIVK